MAGNLVKVKDQIKKWAVAALEEDINGFFGTNASNIVIAMNEEIKELVDTKVNIAAKPKTFISKFISPFSFHLHFRKRIHSPRKTQNQTVKVQRPCARLFWIDSRKHVMK